MTVKPVVCCVLAAGLLSVALPLSAQEAVPAGLLTEVCLPFANRALTLERSVKAARELEFRRPVNDTALCQWWFSSFGRAGKPNPFVLRHTQIACLAGACQDDRPASPGW